MSHKRVVEDAKKNGYKRVLILEDDILIHKNFLNLFQKISKAPNWDMLFFGCNFIDPIRKSQLMNKEGFVTAEIETGSYAYAIDQKFYDEYLNKINEFEYPMSRFLIKLRIQDEMLRNFCHGNLLANIRLIKLMPMFDFKTNKYKNHYIMMPKIISTHVLDSDICPESSQKSFLRVSGVNMEDFF
jgi:GR25 family glycosyltransferase involved in LPS biosynthesis